MGHAMVAGGARASVPVTGIKLGDIAVGQLVKINENGSPVEFYVAKHDYESALNGVGRTLLVRKDCYKLSSMGGDQYANSNLETWLNSDYLGLFSDSTQDAIGSTQFYYTPSKTNTTLSVLERSVFFLSEEELGGDELASPDFGGSHYSINEEGTRLPIRSSLRIAYYNEEAVYWYTRSITSGNYRFVVIMNTGYNNYTSNGNNTVGARPCFTLPSGALFDEETMLFNGKVVS